MIYINHFKQFNFNTNFMKKYFKFFKNYCENFKSCQLIFKRLIHLKYFLSVQYLVK